MKTIQSKILFVVITALIVITAIVTTIALSITHEIMHKDADRILNNVSQKEAALINDMLNDFMKSASITEHYAAHELESPQALADAEYLAAYTQGVRLLFDEIAANTAGAYSYYICFSPALTGKTSGFYSQFEADGKLHELSAEQFSGLSILTEEDLIGYSNYSGSAVGEWVEPHPSRFTGESVISYILPIYSEETFIGLLGFNMQFDYLLDRVNQIALYEYGSVLLMDADQSICYNSSEETEFKGEYTQAATPLVNGMSLELRVAYKDIQSGIRPMLTYITAAFLVVLVLAILYTFWVTHRIVAPLKKLTSVAKNIPSSVQSVDLIVESNDEVGVLSRVMSETYEKIREYSAYINALAYRDSLTGIKNSTAYTEAIEEINKEINLGNPPFGVIVADINNLKQTNDTYGHEIGNELIVHASRILTDTFKASSIFRIGGDEFVVILRGKDFEKYRTLIEKMDEALSTDYITVNDDTIGVSVARGVAIFDPLIDHVYTDVFAKADHAMYMHKMSTKGIPVS